MVKNATEIETEISFKISFSLIVGDSLSYHNNMPFSTYNRDNDDRSGYNCAADSGLKGAWWFNNCWSSSLNGKYSNNYFAGGIKYSSWRPSQNLKESSMMIRRT